jgi:hypothetical protein
MTQKSLVFIDNTLELFLGGLECLLGVVDLWIENIVYRFPNENCFSTQEITTNRQGFKPFQILHPKEYV